MSGVVPMRDERGSGTAHPVAHRTGQRVAGHDISATEHSSHVIDTECVPDRAPRKCRPRTVEVGKARGNCVPVAAGVSRPKRSGPRAIHNGGGCLLCYRRKDTARDAQMSNKIEKLTERMAELEAGLDAMDVEYKIGLARISKKIDDAKAEAARREARRWILTVVRVTVASATVFVILAVVLAVIPPVTEVLTRAL